MSDRERRSRTQWIGLAAGPVAACIVIVVLAALGKQPDHTAAALGGPGRFVIGTLVWMAVWWMTEAIDVAGTALLPLVLLPLGTIDAFDSAGGAMRAAAAPYADSNIALFLGGFMLALSMERWGLHRRIALLTLCVTGTRPTRLIAGFMAVTAVLSMWVSNTATTVMMLPIALSVLGLADDRGGTATAGPFDRALLLGIAYSASIGGIGTLIGTPPNVLFAGFARETYGIEIGFLQWMLVGVPFVSVFVPLVWLLLTRVLLRVPNLELEAPTLIRRQLRELGPPRAGEIVTFIVFMLTAATWMTRPWLVTFDLFGAQPFAGLTDAGIAMLAGVLLLVIPVRGEHGMVPTLDWPTVMRVPWGILLLFGGGLSLAAAVQTHGVAEFVGAQLHGLNGVPDVVVIAIVVVGMILLTEMTSNTATTATLLPLLAGAAASLEISAAGLLVPAVLAASCAFMMPIATPPNAIIFGSGRVTIPQMCRVGLWMNLVGSVLILLLGYTVIGRVIEL